MRISRASVSRRRRRAISAASGMAALCCGSCIDLLLDEGGTVLQRGTALLQTTAEGHPGPIHEGDPREIQGERATIVNEGLAGPADLVHPRPHHLAFQLNRHPLLLLLAHLDLEHDAPLTRQGTCPRRRGRIDDGHLVESATSDSVAQAGSEHAHEGSWSATRCRGGDG